MAIMQTRRGFLTTLSLAGAAGFLHTPQSLGATEPPEITSVRFMRQPSICHAPEFVVEDLLRAEGFTDIRYLDGASSAEINEAVASGKVDFNMHFAPQWVSVIDAGGAMTVLAGVHVGCFELFGNEGIRSIADLKGKSVGVTALGGATTCSCRSWPRISGSTPPTTSIGSPANLRGPTSCLLTARSTPASACRLCLKICGPGMSATWSSTARWTSHGRNISAACWRAIAIMCRNIRSRPSVYFAPF